LENCYEVASKASEKFFTKTTENTDTAELLNRLNLLPEGMKYIGYHKIKTSLGLVLTIYHSDRVEFSFVYEKDKTSLDACVLTFEMIKKYMIANPQSIDMSYMCSPCHYYSHAYKPINGRFLPQMTSEDFREECLLHYNDEYYLVLTMPIK
ncbi:MAG: hypothetical protein IKA03_02715, partial [Alphaproteobacteria bacterium]|nr:hypothetical protein [Alphaproteobacteria bacterium]